jgi:23S rRNA (cytosine1962-C5)-methyltransferase
VNIPSITLVATKNEHLALSHPWIYPDSIASLHNVTTGQLVVIFNQKGEKLGMGVYNEHSLYRVRVLSTRTDHQDFEAIMRYRLNEAKLLRDLMGLPSAITNAFRLCNSEADGLSGLIIDYFDTHLVVMSSALWVELQRQVLTDILKQLFPAKTIVWFSHKKHLQQDGYKGEFSMPVDESTIILEEGVKFSVNFLDAQKTGLFLDQRENHLRLAQFVQNKVFLDLYSYSGGFALHAAKQGAKKVIAIDSAESAIEMGKQNAILNELSNIEWIKGDVTALLSFAANADVISMDPPKLAPSKRHLEKAKNYYRFLHREVFKIVKPGTVIMTSNCSSAVSSELFTDLVYQQARWANRDIRILGVYGPSMCHITLPHFKEGQYLTAILLTIF